MDDSEKETASLPWKILPGSFAAVTLMSRNV